MNIELPNDTDLDAIVAEGTAKQSVEEWENNMLTVFADIVKEEPQRYLAFGYFWWAIKQLMQERGIADFGDETDAELLDATVFSDPALLIAAAFSYQNDRFIEGLIYEARHTYLDKDTGDIQDYILADSDMDIQTFS